MKSWMGNWRLKPKALQLHPGINPWQSVTGVAVKAFKLRYRQKQQTSPAATLQAMRFRVQGLGLPCQAMISDLRSVASSTSSIALQHTCELALAGADFGVFQAFWGASFTWRCDCAVPFLLQLAFSVSSASLQKVGLL